MIIKVKCIVLNIKLIYREYNLEHTLHYNDLTYKISKYATTQKVQQLTTDEMSRQASY